MRTNGDLTLYSHGVNPTTRSETWTRSVIYGVCWETLLGVTYGQNGAIRKDVIAVFIPIDHYPTNGIKRDDVIVRGVSTDEISSTFTMGDLRAKYPENATVRTVGKMDLGSKNIQHYQVEGE